MLENACMKDEPLPEPIRGPERASPGGPRVSASLGLVGETWKAAAYPDNAAQDQD